MRPLRALLATVAAASLLVAGPHVSAEVVTTHGPYGGTVNAIAVSPADSDIVLAATDQGIFRSVSGGASWEQSSHGLSQFKVSALVHKPGHPSVVFAGTSEGVERSTDGGSTWAPLDVVSHHTSELHVSPQDPDTIVAKGINTVHRSIDGGDTWTKVYGDGSIDGEVVYASAVAPSDANRIYVATKQGRHPDISYRTRRSDDGGANWRVMQPTLLLRAIAINPADPDEMWATDSHALHRSQDGGASWQHAEAPAGFVNDIRFGTEPGHLVAAGEQAGSGGWGYIASSRDGGLSWNVAKTPFYAWRVAVDPRNPDVVYGGLRTWGVYKSTDGAATASARNRGLAATPLHGLAIDRSDPQRLYATLGSSGAFHSEDAGRTWLPMHDAMRSPLAPEGGQIHIGTLTVDRGNTLYATVSDDGGRRFMSSTDGGEVWVPRSLMPSAISLHRLLAHPTDADVLLASYDWGSLTSPEGTIQRSVDGGTTWVDTSPSQDYVFDMAQHGGSDTVVIGYSRYTDGGGLVRRLYRSDDFGLTWAPLPFVPDDGWWHGETTLAFGRNRDTIFVGTAHSKLWRTTDAGATWALLEIDSTGRSHGVQAIAVDPEDPNQVLVGTQSGGLWLSKDLGETWGRITTGGYGQSVKTITFARRPEPEDEGLLSSRPALAGMSANAGSGMWRVVLRPHERRPAKVLGTPVRGERLTCSRGRWSRSDTFAYRWFRSGDRIPDAVGATYRVLRADRGEMLTCRAIGSGPGGRWAGTRSPGVRIR